MANIRLHIEIDKVKAQFESDTSDATHIQVEKILDSVIAIMYYHGHDYRNVIQSINEYAKEKVEFEKNNQRG